MKEDGLKVYCLSFKYDKYNYELIIFDLLSNVKIKSHRYYLYYDNSLIRINSIRHFLESIYEVDDNVTVSEVDDDVRKTMLLRIGSMNDRMKNNKFDEKNYLYDMLYDNSKGDSEVLSHYYDEFLSKFYKEKSSTIFSPMSEEDKEKLGYYLK